MVWKMNTHTHNRIHKHKADEKPLEMYIIYPSVDDVTHQVINGDVDRDREKKKNETKNQNYVYTKTHPHTHITARNIF